VRLGIALSIVAPADCKGQKWQRQKQQKFHILPLTRHSLPPACGIVRGPVIAVIHWG
jgi:hypothetical protein